MCLRFAAREGRLLVTHDQSTVPNHFSRFIEAATSPGLLIVPQHLPPTGAEDELRRECRGWCPRSRPTPGASMTRSKSGTSTSAAIPLGRVAYRPITDPVTKTPTERVIVPPSASVTVTGR